MYISIYINCGSPMGLRWRPHFNRVRKRYKSSTLAGHCIVHIIVSLSYWHKLRPMGEQQLIVPSQIIYLDGMIRGIGTMVRVGQWLALIVPQLQLTGTESKPIRANNS
jgi:hypothetical protein